MITSNYRTDNTKLFVDTFDTNDYYIFIASVDEGEVNNTVFSKNDILEKTIFGKQITKENAFYAIQNTIWEGGDVYTQYDDRADLVEKNFYAVVYPANNDTGNYLVFKCLFNNYDAPSTIPPNYDQAVQDQIYRTADGYVWKYMYAISEVEFDKYTTLGYIPIIDDSISANTVVSIGSPIEQIFIENNNSNAGYEDVTIRITTIENGVINFEGRGYNLNVITDSYSGRTLYVTNGNDESEVFEIENYSYNTSTRLGSITLTTSFDTLESVANTATDTVYIRPNVDASILPRIVVKGDGSGCSAIPIIDGSRIDRILILNAGANYRNATAEVINPFGFNPSLLNSTDEKIILRPIISPKGGHGSNIIDELNSSRVILYTNIEEIDNITIPTSNKYSKLALVKNPEFSSNTAPLVFDNRLQLELNTTESLFIDEILSQEDINNEITFQGRIHEISSNNVIYVTEYMGPYLNSANTEYSDISLNLDYSLLSSQSQLLEINNITTSDYVQRTGHVYYAAQFQSIARTPASREEYKIVLEF